MNAFKTAYAMAFLYDMAIERRTLANFWVFSFFWRQSVLHIGLKTIIILKFLAVRS